MALKALATAMPFLSNSTSKVYSFSRSRLSPFTLGGIRITKNEGSFPLISSLRTTISSSESLEGRLWRMPVTELLLPDNELKLSK